MGLFDIFSKRNEKPARISDDVNVLRVGNQYLVDNRLWAWVNPTARTAFDAAQAAVKRGDSDAAIASYKTAISAEPRWSSPYYELGVVLDRLGYRQQAATWYEKSIELDPQWPAAYYNLGKYLRDVGDYGPALTLLKRYIVLDPSDPEGYLSIGLIYDALGDSESESLAYEQALKVDVNCFQAHINLGINRLNEGQKHLAIRHFERAIELTPPGTPQHEKARAELARCQ